MRPHPATFLLAIGAAACATGPSPAAHTEVSIQELEVVVAPEDLLLARPRDLVVGPDGDVFDYARGSILDFDTDVDGGDGYISGTNVNHIGIINYFNYNLVGTTDSGIGGITSSDDNGIESGIKA